MPAPSTNSQALWRLFVDTGGTFTDCLALDPAGRWRRAKVLSSGALRGRVAGGRGQHLALRGPWPAREDFLTGYLLRPLGAPEGSRVLEHTVPGSSEDSESTVRLDGAPALPAGTPVELLSPEPAPVLAARVVTATPLRDPLPPMVMRLATTRGTNALLTRGGVPPVLLINRGFGDLLEIGTQARPELFSLEITKPEPLHDRVIELAGRLDATGREIEDLDTPAALERMARTLADEGRKVAAVALLHADKNPRVEATVRAALEGAGFTHVSCSAELAPSIKILPRAETAVVNAYLAPLLEDYVRQVQQRMGGGQLLLMTSAGGLSAAAGFEAKDALLSGPAGGITGAARIGEQVNESRLLSFDMGGTSTDVARYDGDFEYVFEHTVGDAHLVAPALAIETVAAGGGSICHYDGLRLGVGPESAAADPGPACYGAGGPLTVTDVNLALGRIDTGRFEIPLDEEAARLAAESLAASLADGGQPPDTIDLLEGLLDLANEKMADAIRKISVRSGYDPRDYALVAFGGAGPQHAFAIAGRLGIERVIVARDASLLSTHGLAAAARERIEDLQLLAPLPEAASRIEEGFAEIRERAVTRLRDEGADPSGLHLRRRQAALRFLGQDASLIIDLLPGADPAALFLERYRQVYGHLPEERKIEVVSLRGIVSELPAAESPAPRLGAGPATPRGVHRCRFSGRWLEVPVFERETLGEGARLAGPCLIAERYSVTVVEPGWQVTVDGHGHLLGVRQPASAAGNPAGESRGERPEAVRLELFSQRLTRIAEEMGEALRRSAVSTNIKERLDFSCAVLDAQGGLLVNAPHIPVHLGSLGMCVRAVMGALEMEAGDTIVTNHPAYGGSHLPDITLISPVYSAGGRRVAFVVNRAHHAEIGGISPGSMPASARSLAEEGVVLEPQPLMRRGRVDWPGIRGRLTGGPFPTRAVEDNLADLRAGLAANLRGVAEIESLCREIGAGRFQRRAEALCRRAETRAREALEARGPLRAREVEVLDDGTEIPVSLEIRGGRLRASFEGGPGVHPGNLNATPAIVSSTVLYVLRLLLERPFPLNEGLLRAAEIVLPSGMLNPPFPEDPGRCPAVVGGNVETSQRLVNAMVRALRLAASSQGTMNNLIFGDASRSYYETIGGGAGAGPGFDGASAVQTHMTNTRVTDPEIIEHRFPVRVERFAVRRGSGGAGRHRGGDGLVREFRFLEPMSVSVLGQHRRKGPEGMEGGESGAAGATVWIKAGGETLSLGSVGECTVEEGDRILVKTPGGGGWGRP